jgi:hypothetical protein
MKGQKGFQAKGKHEKHLGGAPGRTRTCGPRFRKPLLYPPELQAHKELRAQPFSM